MGIKVVPKYRNLSFGASWTTLRPLDWPSRDVEYEQGARERGPVKAVRVLAPMQK